MTTRTTLALLLALCLLNCGAARAAPFEMSVSPSRYELSAAAGTRVGQVLELRNMGAAPVQLTVRTLDWTYSTEGEIGYHDELLPGSCRPWVTLERRTLTLGAQEKRGFRFQVEVPPGTPRGECRFMVAVEGVEPAYQAVVRQGGMNLNLPVSGRMAVAVYVAVGGAVPRLTLESAGMRQHQGRNQPVVVVRNEGDAHGRLTGLLSARGAEGRTQEWMPENTPVMPGQTRQLVLAPRAQDGAAPDKPLKPPISAKGLLDWDDGSFRVEAEFR